jgi:hypothetical protein
MEKEFIGIELPKELQTLKAFYRQSKWERKKMAAAYYDGNRFIAAFNSKKTHPMAKRFNHLQSRTHCEIATLQQIKQNNNLTGTLYIYREASDSSARMARCCSACIRYIRSRGIRKICYTTNTGWIMEHLD